MQGMDKLQQLISACKCGVYVEVNRHRDYYEQVAERMEEARLQEALAPEVLAEMIARDTVVEIQFYPRTPNTFYRVFHYDLDTALTEALEALAPHATPSSASDEDDPLRCGFCGEIGLYLEGCSGESPDLHYLYKCKFCRNVRWSKEKYFAGYDD